MTLHDLSRIHKSMNSFGQTSRFTIDLFGKEIPCFVDVKLSPDGISIYLKDSNTVLYVNYLRFLNNLSLYLGNMLFYGVLGSMLDKPLQAQQDKVEHNVTEKKRKLAVICFCNLLYYGETGFLLIKCCIRKIKANSESD